MSIPDFIVYWFLAGLAIFWLATVTRAGHWRREALSLAIWPIPFAAGFVIGITGGLGARWRKASLRRGAAIALLALLLTALFLAVLGAVAHAGSGVGAHDNPPLITVDSAAGPITVAPEFAPKIVPFIAAVVALTGAKPTRVKCYSTAASHVAGSLHFRGRACDFAQRAWGVTSYRVMYAIEALARRYGLRDGCEFRDWGHIDDGPHLPASRTQACRAGPFVTAHNIAARELAAAGAAP
jgi:hypothetical protein